GRFLCNTHLIASHVEAGIAKTGGAATAQKGTVCSIAAADIIAAADGIGFSAASANRIGWTALSKGRHDTAKINSLVGGGQHCVDPISGGSRPPRPAEDRTPLRSGYSPRIPVDQCIRRTKSRASARVRLGRQR